jgi:natural product biosynthesis luciferase-like monooxygenase protein
MEISLFYFADAGSVDTAETYRLLLEGARHADRSGLSAVWIPERHFHPFGGIYPNPSVTAAAIAAVTERVGIRAGSVVAPLHDPIRIAEEWAVVDRLSHGRVGISFASGWQPVDFVLAPDAYARRKELLPELVNEVRRLWRGEPVTRRDGKGELVEVGARPRPVQPELPVWVTSSGSPETFVVAGTLRANLLTHLLGQDVASLREKIAAYRGARAAAGDGAGHVTLMLHCFLHEDAAVARETTREPFLAYLKSSYSLAAGWAQKVMPGFDVADVTEADLDFVLGRAFDRYYGESGLFGTPADAARTLERLEDAGVDEVACLIDFGIAADDALESLDLLAALAPGRASAIAGRT